ncbi:MAG: Tex-like N-terminal domain-containing protein [Crocinitomicaceae bacterium]
MLVNNYIKLKTTIPSDLISNVLKYRAEGASIPFIARYRKEGTGNLDEVEIESIFKAKSDFEELCKRKEYILSVLVDRDVLTEALKADIDNCIDLSLLEDIYLPFKRKKQTKADIAIKSRLLGLAKLIMSQKHDDIHVLAKDFIRGSITSTSHAIDGAEAIIIDWISTHPVVREKLRNSFLNYGILSSIKTKNAIDVSEKYRNFYDFNQPIKNCPSYRLLAIYRGEDEKILKVKVRPNIEFNLNWLNRFYIKSNNASSELVKSAIKKAYAKVLYPSIEAEVKSLYKNLADDKSIVNFRKNLRQILLSPPIGEKRILAIDPGFRSGCKIVCLSATGELLHNTTVYPHAPQKEKSKAASKISQLVEIYKIDAIAIGDGTAGRETENLIKQIKFNKPLLAYMVREDGASIYSASKIAREEFPDFDVTVRGAVSIGRRLSDPLAELVKIDAKSLGIGQYQHDVNQVKLNKALDLTVENVVNKVGVNLNTASKHLLSYVSGIGPKMAETIVDYRNKYGSFKSKESIKNVPRFGRKSFEQAAGFLRIKGGDSFLDDSSIHPEQYAFVSSIAKQHSIALENLVGNSDILIAVENDKKLIEKVGVYTLRDIVAELKKPGLDPRMAARIFSFSDNISSINDLKIGMKLKGLVTNVTDFGAFVNIGIKTNGLIHKTEIAEEFVEHPSDFLAIDQQVLAKVILIEQDRNRIGLSLK